MDYAMRLNQIIDIAGKGQENLDYSNYESQAELDVLKNANVFLTTSVLGMKAISHVIEDQAVSLGGSFRFYSAFQRYSRAKLQQQRYNNILATNNPVYLFGIPDVPLWQNPNLIEVNLEEPVLQDRPYLAQNWFVILHNPQFVSMALVSREIPNSLRPVGAPDKLVYRNFEGFWTYDKDVITQVVEILDGYIGHKLGNQVYGLS